MFSICFGAIAWNVAVGVFLSVLFIAIVSIVFGTRYQRRRFVIGGAVLGVIAIALFVTEGFSQYYVDGVIHVDVRLVAPDSTVNTVSYMPAWKRSAAEFVIDRAPEFDEQFTLAILQQDGNFEAEGPWSERIAWYGLSRRPWHFSMLILLIEFSDGSQKRLIVDVPDLQNTKPKDRVIVVNLQPDDQ
jgi:hypothetical protein